MDKTEQDWDRMAQFYEDFTSGEDSYSADIEWPCILRMLPDLNGQTVLDLGCGTGRYAFLFEELGAASVTGADISGNMLRLAKAKASERNSNAVFIKADISKPFTERKFDFIFSSTVSHYIQDLTQLFSNIHSMLKYGGTCVISAMHPVYSAQYPIKNGDVFPDDSQWTVRYLDMRERSYIQPWIEHNDNVENFLSSSCHHTFGDYINSAVNCGFDILEIREPAPPDSWTEKFPGRYDSFIETPSYMIIKLRKK